MSGNGSQRLQRISTIQMTEVKLSEPASRHRGFKNSIQKIFKEKWQLIAEVLIGPPW